MSTLYFLQDKETENIVDVSTYATDTVDMFIQELDDLDISNPNLESLIWENSFMQNEIKRQANVIDYLNSIESVAERDLEVMRQIVKDDIIDVSLLKEI